VPEPVIRRRYEAGLRNFHGIYADVATTWQLLDNEGLGDPHLIAERASDGRTVILDGDRWKRLVRP